MGDPSFWNDQAKAREVIDEANKVKQWVAPWAGLTARAADAAEMLDLLEVEEDSGMLEEVTAEIERIGSELASLELRNMLQGPDDHRDALVTLQSGAGGTESQDWAEMLLRMYTRWAERHGFDVELLDQQEGEEAGIKSATLEVRGEYAYGYLRAERGVHRLVRISPFDSQARRHTSFASVFVYPSVDDTIEIEVREEDIEMDVFRASGAGGQHVNKTSSAVRLRHLPSGIVVECQQERSQHKNRATAWNMLRARLYEAELRKREEKANAEQAAKTDIGWGHQIRSYVLQPYQLVKDLRTGVTSGVPSDVLDGDLDPFMEAALAQRVYGGQAEVEDID